MCKLDFKNSMEIDFMNKACCQMTQYSKNTIAGMKVNALMPKMVSENHSNMIKRYVDTGKVHIINKKRK